MPHLANLLLAILLTGYFLPHITDAAPASAAPPRFPSADAGQRRCSVDTVKNFYTILFGFAGVMHFIRPATFDALVPEQLPGRQRTWTYGSGVCELVAAALLSNRRTRSFGGLFSAAMLLGVWPGNIYMARNYLTQQDPPRSPLAKAVAVARVPLQIPLIRGAWKIYRESPPQ